MAVHQRLFLTGYDTIQTLGELLQAQERFMGRTEVVPSHAGIKGVKGREVGFKVATYHDIPIIPCKDMPTGGSGISDILFLIPTICSCVLLSQLNTLKVE